MFDTCILGAGPAGLSAALWLHNLGLRPIILDRSSQPGGAQRLNFLTNDWMLGAIGLTGPQLAERFVAHVAALPVPIEVAAQLADLRREPAGFALAFRRHEERREIRCRTIIVATGSRYRGAEVLADIPGFAGLRQEVVAFGPYAFADLDNCAGRRVLIVGGGDNAFENAKRLIGRAAAVIVLVRSRPRAQAQLVAALRHSQATGACEIVEGAVIVGLAAVPTGVAATVAAVGDGPGRVVECDRIHVLAGYEPNTDFLEPLARRAGMAPLRRDDEGYLVVDARAATSCPGIYAAGDVCNRQFPSVVSAISQGAIAAKAIEADLAA